MDESHHITIDMKFENVDSETGIEDPSELVPEIDGEQVEFLIPPDQAGVWATPKPAVKCLPQWYQRLDDGSDQREFDRTVKACRPFMDALTMGWIIPAPTKIEITVDSTGTRWDAEWHDDYRDHLSSHSLDQVGGEMFPQSAESIILKFLNPWTVRTPDGYSTLFTNPMNNPNPHFQTFSGVVDTDDYLLPPNLPIMFTSLGETVTIERGTPIAQVIPFERDGILTESKKRSLNDEERDATDLILKRINNSNGYYAENVWTPKTGSREIADSEQ